MDVRKRDGRVEAFDKKKIFNAIKAAFGDSPASIETLTNAVLDYLPPDDPINIERIQDVVEFVLMRSHPDTAKKYILYRQERAKAREERKSFHADPSIISEYVHTAKYAAHLRHEKRRESYLETSHRSKAMHLAKYPYLRKDIEHYWRFVDDQRVLPSMRSMQFAGPRIIQHNASIYNCSFSLCDRPRFFGELLYILLAGCGTGHSVQSRHVYELPEIGKKRDQRVRHFSIPDTIEGWGDALYNLMDAAIDGYYIEFDYSHIRPEGAPLINSGGKAPGHLPLKRMLERVREILQGAQHRKLRPIECFDITCHAAECVLSGGIRRSSMLVLFDKDDQEMLYSKHPDNFQFQGKNKHREMANISAAFLRDTVTEEEFRNVIDLNQANYGEPGFMFLSHPDYGTNPCGEIGLNPKLGPATGWQFCNLCEINAAKFESTPDFYYAAEAAAFIGTLQAGYNSFPYLGEVTEMIVKRESLLGVGITGMLDSPKIALDPKAQAASAEIVRATNKEWAARIQIPPATRCTTVKPSGTASLELGAIASGIHPHHHKRYFRRVTANPNEQPAQYLRQMNPHMVEVKPNGDLSLIFCVEPKPDALTLEDIDGLQLLEYAILTKENWIEHGTDKASLISPDLRHNVSLTVHFTKENFPKIVDRIWEKRDVLQAVSFLPTMSDRNIPFIPRKGVRDEQDEQEWKNLLSKFQPIIWSEMVEEDDNTQFSVTAACVGGACDIEEAEFREMLADGTELIFLSDLSVTWGPVSRFVHHGRMYETIGQKQVTSCGNEYLQAKRVPTRGMPESCVYIQSETKSTQEDA